MENISYKISAPLNSQAIEHLYQDAGWTKYTRDIPKLMQALENSIQVITAWDQDQLVGLIRAVGDGLVILYIQDILVLKSHKRKGIGSTLLKSMLAENVGIRQIVLLTTDTFETRLFYESLGFAACEADNSVAFVIHR